ncbi:hypothetical protein Ciccas_013051 [Cichlidogyrus casuarinus]|uniref:Cystatin domain-containing protein n=1 Tax=Cichlidogyrus casuarinus TaxID=1844966 RepID=A0ABD2PM65_9PLAT
MVIMRLWLTPDGPDSIELNCVKEEERPQMRLGGQIAADVGYQETEGYKNITGFVLAEFEKVYETKGTVVEHIEYATQVINGIVHKLVVRINAEDCDCVYRCEAWVIMRPWLKPDGPDFITLDCVNKESSFELLDKKITSIFSYILYIILKV